MDDKWIANAASEIHSKISVEPAREVDEDGEICAWYVEPSEYEITEIINRHMKSESR